ncbi:MAG: VTT domain-containing protein [Acidobacteriia bacterium]|nr:VTT domain-containing protein [Terriglobia bacterium]
MLAKITFALVAYGPWGLLLVGFIDSLGIPLPAMDFFLLGIALKAPERAYFAALMAVLGSVGGNIALFLGARHGVRRLVKTVEDPGKPRRFQEWFRRYGLVTVFVPAVVPLLPLPLKVFVISAGVLHTPIGKFVAVILVARLLRYFGDTWLGIHLGSGAQAFLVRNAWTLAGIALALSLVFFLWIRWAGRNNRAA